MSPRQKRERVAVEQDPQKPVERTVLAAAITKLSRAAQELNARSGLNQDAIVTLLARSSGVRRTDIVCVLDALKQLERDFCQ